MDVIGVIGLGRIGAAVAAAFLGGGHRVVGYQRSAAVEFEQSGGSMADSPRDLLERCDIVFLGLPTADALRSVVWGEHGLVGAQARPAAVVVDLSTVGLDDKLAVREALAAGGVGMLDCPVSGMPVPGRRPPLDSMFASGDAEHLERCEEALRVVVSNLWKVGAFGHGLTLKLVANTLVSLHTVAAAEALALGVRAGLDADLMVETLTSSPATSWVLEDRAGRMVHGEHQPPRASVELLLKDLGLIRDLAAATETPLPNLEAALHTFERARDQGWGGHDVTVVYRLAAEAIDGSMGDDDV